MTLKIDTQSPAVKAEFDGRVGWITFNDPARHNTMTSAMWGALPAAVAGLLGDSAVRVIVLKGAGDKAFVSGADISEFESHAKDPACAAAYDQILQDAVSALRNAPCPVIAMINGYCIGGGMSLALASDIRIASHDATFAIPAARLGLAYPKHMIADLVSVAGTALAKELLFTARRLNADEALARGLINNVVDKGELERETKNLAAIICDNAPLTLTAAKRAIDFISKDTGSEFAVDQLAETCANSADTGEGRAAFAEKRPPVFTGT